MYSYQSGHRGWINPYLKQYQPLFSSYVNQNPLYYLNLFELGFLLLATLIAVLKMVITSGTVPGLAHRGR